MQTLRKGLIVHSKCPVLHLVCPRSIVCIKNSCSNTARPTQSKSTLFKKMNQQHLRKAWIYIIRPHIPNYAIPRDPPKFIPRAHKAISVNDSKASSGKCPHSPFSTIAPGSAEPSFGDVFDTTAQRSFRRSRINVDLPDVDPSTRFSVRVKAFRQVSPSGGEARWVWCSDGNIHRFARVMVV
jgi:hypothetical protein